ncbi:thioredoxin [Pelomonas sp. HMWF004]|nr:thioredoxin [Pelomonas sp. HMWF004]
MSKHLLTLDDDSLDSQLLQAPGVALLDFWAEWCAPCKMLLPTVHELADLYAGEVRVATINADQNPKSAEQFSVRGLPTLVILRNGKEVDRVVGTQSKTRLAALLDRYLTTSP